MREDRWYSSLLTFEFEPCYFTIPDSELVFWGCCVILKYSQFSLALWNASYAGLGQHLDLILAIIFFVLPWELKKHKWQHFSSRDFHLISRQYGLALRIWRIWEKPWCEKQSKKGCERSIYERESCPKMFLLECMWKFTGKNSSARILIFSWDVAVMNKNSLSRQQCFWNT